MGLQSQLNDFSSESVPLLLVALIANCFGCLRNLLADLLQSTGLLPCPADRSTSSIDDVGVLGSDLAGLILLAEQLDLNKAFSYKYSGGGGSSDCVVCLCTLRDGEQVRKLDCCHVFHKDCFDGWLDHLNFNCPLCRSPLMKTDDRVHFTRRCVSEDLLAWFSLR